MLVLVGVADRQSAVPALHHQQLHPVGGGGRRLRLAGVEGLERLAGVGRVVAEAVGVGDGGGQLLAERFGLHHLEAHPPHREPGPGQFADEAAEPGAGRQDHGVAGVRVAVVVADRGGAGHLAHLTAAEEGVPARGQQRLLQGELGGARLHRRVPLAPQGGGERAAQRRVDRAGLGGGEQTVAALGGVRAGDGRLGDGHLPVGAQRGERAARAEAQLREVRPDALPQLAGAQRGPQLLAARAAAHPYLSEVAERGSARLLLPLDLYDLVAALDCVPGVHGSHHTGSYDDDLHGANGAEAG